MEKISNKKSHEMISNKKSHVVKEKYFIIPKKTTTLPTRVTADVSSYGLGGCLEQQHTDKEHSKKWKPVYFAYRSLNETERRYAQIEKEALAI